MPDLDFALIADYVRADGGVAHMIGGGIDTVHAPAIPFGQNVGLLARLKLTPNECGRPHRVEVFFQDADGQRLAEITGTFSAEWSDDGTPGGKVGVLLAFNIVVPMPTHGLYSFELLVNDSSIKSIPLRVVPRQGGEAEPGG